MTPDELVGIWCAKRPTMNATPARLDAFALGVQVGSERAHADVPAGFVRFDLPADECFITDGNAHYPMWRCMDCKATHYGPTRIEHATGCRVAAALAAVPPSGGTHA